MEGRLLHRRIQTPIQQKLAVLCSKSVNKNQLNQFWHFATVHQHYIQTYTHRYSP